MDKQVGSPCEAVADIADGAVLGVGGFGPCGVPVTLIAAVLDSGARELATVTNNYGAGTEGLSVLLHAGRIGSLVEEVIAATGAPPAVADDVRTTTLP